MNNLKIGNIVESKLSNNSFIVESISEEKVVIASCIDTMNKKELTKDKLNNYTVIGNVETMDGRYKKFPINSISKDSIQDKQVDTTIQNIISPAEMMDIENWAGINQLDDVFKLIKSKDWDKLKKVFPSLKDDSSFYSFHHNLNPMTVFSTLYKELGKDTALNLATDYEKEVWGLHKDSVYTDGVYSLNRNNGQPFDLEPQRTPYPNGLVPVMKNSSENDFEMENSDESGHGSLAPSDMRSIDSTPKVKQKSIERLPTLDIDKVEWLNKLSNKIVNFQNKIEKSASKISFKLSNFIKA